MLYAVLATFVVSVIPIVFLTLLPIFVSEKGAAKGKKDESKRGKKGSGHASAPPVTISAGWLQVFLALAAGALLGDAFLHLLQPEHANVEMSHGKISHNHSHHNHSHHDHSHHGHSHHGHSHHSHSSQLALAGIVTFFLLELASRAFEAKDGHDCDHGHGHGHGHGHSHGHKHGVSSVLSLIADAIHNFTDGLTIAAAFAANWNTGLTTTIAIFVHEIPHELGDYAILARSGFDHGKIIRAQLFTALAAFAGTFTGLFLLSFSESSGAIDAICAGILPFSAGGFVYLALASIIPELLQGMEFSKPTALLGSLSFFLGGVGLMFILE